MTTIAEKMAELERINAKRAELWEEFKHSMALKEFFPKAFDAGNVSVYPKGNPTRPLDMKLCIKTADGKVHEFCLLDCPPVLWKRWMPLFREQCARTSIRPRQWQEQSLVPGLRS